MAFTLLPALQPHDRHALVRVHISRKWEFRGGSDDGALQHIDMVLTDEQVLNKISRTKIVTSLLSYSVNCTTSYQIQFQCNSVYYKTNPMLPCLYILL